MGKDGEAEPTNMSLYQQVKAEADVKFQSKTGIYKSSWIVREYKKRGGTYRGKRSAKSGLLRWYREQWVDLNRPILKNGKVTGYEPCGRPSLAVDTGLYPLCRPLKKITKNTPVTLKQLTESEIRKANELKQRLTVKGSVKRFKDSA